MHSIVLVLLLCPYFVNSNLLIDVFDTPSTALDGLTRVLLPDITNITNQISPNAFIYDQNSNFRRAVAELKAILLGLTNVTDFLAMVEALQNDPQLHPRIFSRAVIGAILNRDDRANFRIPSLLEVEPDSAFSMDIMEQIQTQWILPVSQRNCVVVDETTGADNLIENALWYFRQDPFVNSFHWFWHLYYPFDSFAARDRRGELFYDMHHNVMARYYAERLSNSLLPITPLSVEKNRIIPEGYDAHLTETNAKQNWTNRPPARTISDTVEASFVNLSIDEAVLWRTRILNGIDAGNFLLPNGSMLPLRNVYGIDALGDTLESSVFSVNPAYYGKFGYHNAGHIFIGNVMHPHDPTSSYPPGVMSDTATAMRDIIFYRWHTYVDRIFQRHKGTLTPYQPSGGDLPLIVPGLYVDSVQVRIKSAAPTQVNLLHTFWTSTMYNLTNGLDFKRNQTKGQGSVQVCVKHLDHADFEYKIAIRNTKATPTKATVRIFLAPRYSNLGVRYSMLEQHALFFTLDTFSVDLVTGTNNIVRQSIDSTLTISLNQALSELNNDQTRSTVFCGCGWPHYMLLPKGGTITWMAFDLFVMVTQDGTSSSIPSISSPPPVATTNQCQESYLYCGSFQSKYPDPKPMGYPFDRLPYSVTDYLISLPLPIVPPLFPYTRIVKNLDEYISPIPNMASTQVQILHVSNPV